MRPRTVLKTLALLLALVLAGALPVQAAESLVLTCTVCTNVVATGKGLPASETVRLNLADLTTGQAVVSPVSVQTDAAGSFVKRVNVDLTVHPSLEASVWAPQGGTLVVAAHSRFLSPCKPKKNADKLPLTGSNSALVLLGAMLLLGVGVVMVKAGRGSARST
jgi:LPXTG-motif cell wall-anchored protein